MPVINQQPFMADFVGSRKTLQQRWAAALACGLIATALGAAGAREDDKRPSLSLKATPLLSFSPARIVLTAELKGGSDHYEEYYCPAVEWDWGDGTRSEASNDCDPYERDKSQIKRRFVVEHVYQTAGNYRVQFRLKKRTKVLANAGVTVQVRPGLRDFVRGNESIDAHL